jgi:hypothetical protein
MSGVNVLAVDLGGSHAECAVIRNNAITATQTVAVSGRSGLGGLLPVIRISGKSESCRCGDFCGGSSQFRPSPPLLL